MAAERIASRGVIGLLAAIAALEWSATGVSQLPPIVIFAAISLVAAALAVRVYGSIGASTPPVTFHTTATAAA